MSTEESDWSKALKTYIQLSRSCFQNQSHAGSGFSPVMTEITLYKVNGSCSMLPMHSSENFRFRTRLFECGLNVQKA